MRSEQMRAGGEERGSWPGTRSLQQASDAGRDLEAIDLRDEDASQEQETNNYETKRIACNVRITEMPYQPDYETPLKVAQCERRRLAQRLCIPSPTRCAAEAV